MRLLLTAALFAIAAESAGGEVIDFNSVVNSKANQIYSGALNVEGYIFTSGHFHITDAPSGCVYGGCTPFNGTQYFSIDGPVLGLPVVMTAEGGAAFDLYSLQAARLFADGDTAEASTFFYNAELLQLTGTLQGGGTVSTSLALPATPGFGTFLLPSTFVNLVSLSISGSVPGITDNASWAIDNLDATLQLADPPNAVEGELPEPAAVLLTAAGLLLIGLRRRFD